MFFKDLEIGDRFSFIRDSKIYRKINEVQCERLLRTYNVEFEFVKVRQVSEEEIEDDLAVKKSSALELISNESN